MALTVDAADWLIEHWPIDGLDAAGGLPAVLPVECGTVRRTGGAAPNRIVDQPLITVEIYAKRKARAFELANEVRTWLLGLSGVHPDVIILWVREAGGPVDLPDPRAPNHTRVTLTVELRIRGARS